MTFDKTLGATTATCDMCGPDWWKGYEDVQPLFTSRGTALRLLPVDFMWSVTEQDDGSLQMLCASCTQLEDCVRNGHGWVPLEYMTDGELRQYGETCSCCSVVRSFDEPPAGHPESMTCELGDDIEEMLAVLDRIEFPDNETEEA